MMQELTVFVIVVCAGWVVAQRYGPAPVRRVLAGMRAKVAGRFGMAGKPAQGSASCGGCDGCSSDASAKSPGANTITPERLKKTIPRH
jgi:hypothetical protein